jgi:hypothetical protein
MVLDLCADHLVTGAWAIWKVPFSRRRNLSHQHAPSHDTRAHVHNSADIVAQGCGTVPWSVAMVLDSCADHLVAGAWAVWKVPLSRRRYLSHRHAPSHDTLPHCLTEGLMSWADHVRLLATQI